MKANACLACLLLLVCSAQTKGQTHWQLRHPLPTPNGLLGVTYGGGIFVAVGYYGTCLTSTDGVNWTSRRPEQDGVLQAVAYGNGKFVAVGPQDDYPSLVDESRGGGNFDKLVGLYLRQTGVSGLVYPSARTDAYTHVVSGEPKEFHDWSFVDYRNAPEQEIVAFFELRPQWPRTLVIEGGDDHEPAARRVCRRVPDTND